MIEIIPSTPEHVRFLGHNMRDQDANEIRALGLVPHRALWRSYRCGMMRETALVNGKIAAMWGVGGTVIGCKGEPWLITGASVLDISPVAFAFIYRSRVRKMLERFHYLENWVDARYTESVRMLKIIGFSLDEPKPLGPNGALFRRFEMRARMEAA